MNRKFRITYSEEDQDIAFRLSGMYLEHSSDSGVEIVGFWLGSVVDIDRELTTRNC